MEKPKSWLHYCIVKTVPLGKEGRRPSMTLKTVQKLSIFTLLLMGLTPPGFAFNPAVDDPKLEASAERYKAATSEYKELLKAKRDFVEAKSNARRSCWSPKKTGKSVACLSGGWPLRKPKVTRLATSSASSAPAKW